MIYIAAAVAVAIDRSQKVLRNLRKADHADLQSDFGGPQISFAHILICPELALSIIRASEGYEDLVLRLPKLKPKHNSMVRLRVAEV